MNMHYIPDTVLKATENKNYESLFKLPKKSLTNIVEEIGPSHMK